MRTYIYAWGLQQQSQTDCSVNPYLLSSNKFRPHLSTYVVISEGQEGAGYFVSDCEFFQMLASTELFLEHGELMAFRLHTNLKYYL